MQNNLKTKNYELKLKREVIQLNSYNKLAKLPVFSIDDVEKLTGNINTAYSQLGSLMKRDLVRKIRRNLYSPVNPVTGQVMASRYQIACAITDTAYISHHSAFEYYGLANQVFYEVYVSSEIRFREFEYDKVTFKYISSRMKDGVIDAKNTTGVRITDLERTVIDSIQDFNKIAGFEELINCLDGIHYLDESKLKTYLDIYNIQALYQKAGFLLEFYKKDMQLSQSFIDYCKNKIGNSRMYLIRDTDEQTYYNNEWKIMVPESILKITDPGGDVLV